MKNHQTVAQPERRAWLRSACAHCMAAGGLFGSFAVQGQTTTQATTFEADLSKRFERPAIDTDEGGLWAMMDREETRLRRSPLAIKDADLTKYLQDMICRLTDTHCPDIRVHVVRTPWFNATMAPNGMMQVWSGLLLRVENEAQLAAVLGHELGHYLERHSLERLRDVKSRAAFAQFLGLFGVVGAIGQIGMLAGAFAFSRDHETRADRMGMKLLQQASWSGDEAPKVWGNLLDEVKIRGGEDVGKRSAMFATHPAIEQRRDELIKLIKPGGQSHPEPLAKVLEKHRLTWVQDEIRRGQFEESMVLFGRMIKANDKDTMALYGRGESYRLRADKDDSDKALADLRAATALDTPERSVPEAWRSLGLVNQQRKDVPAATQAFEKYLALAPEAADANLIKHYLTELKP
jgi:beta-barrel assembly-enhancing protease